jgi:hypothetical protein
MQPVSLKRQVVSPKQGMCFLLKKITGRDTFLHQEGGWFVFHPELE